MKNEQNTSYYSKGDGKMRWVSFVSEDGTPNGVTKYLHKDQTPAFNWFYQDGFTEGEGIYFEYNSPKEDVFKSIVENMELKERYKQIMAENICVVVDDLSPNEEKLIECSFHLFQGKIEEMEYLQDEVKRLNLELINLKAMNERNSEPDFEDDYGDDEGDDV